MSHKKIKLGVVDDHKLFREGLVKLLKDFEDMLVPYHFYRVHNSHLINLNYIQKYLRSNGGRVVMQDGTEIEVARRKKEEFLKMIAG